MTLLGLGSPATGGLVHPPGPGNYSMIEPYNPAKYAALFDAIDTRRFPQVPASLAAVAASLQSMTRMAAAETVGLEAFCDRVMGETLAGGALPDDFAAAALQAERDGERQQAARVACLTLTERMGQKLPEVILAGFDELMAGLAGRVQEALATASDAMGVLGDLDVTNVSDIARASAKQQTAFRKFDAAREVYEDARDAQLLTVRHLPAHGLRRTGFDAVSNLQDSGVLEVAKPRLDPAPAANLDPRTRLVRLLRRDDVWVPTLTQMGENIAGGGR